MISELRSARQFWRSALGAGLLAATSLSALPAAVSVAAGEGPAVALIDWPGLRKEMEARKGTIVILNFWATWCAPCREEFPDLVRYAREQAARVSLVTVSLDDPGTIDGSVKPFLREMKAPGVAFVKGPGDPDAFINGVDPEWSGVLPATFIHDATGRRVHAVREPVSYAKLVDLVTPLLDAKR